MGHQRSLLSRGIDIRSTSVRRRLDYNKVPRSTARPPALSAESRAILHRINERKRLDKHLRSLVVKSAIPIPAQRSRSRKRNPFIDDTAVESDGDGGDVSSTPSSPASPDIEEVPCTPRKGFRLYFPTAAPVLQKPSASKPPLPRLRSKPYRFPTPQKSIFRPAKSFVHIHRFEIKSTLKPSVNSFVTSANVDIKPAVKPVVTTAVTAVVKPTDCDLCGQTVNGPSQLLRHRGTKRCLRRSKNSISK